MLTANPGERPALCVCLLCLQVKPGWGSWLPQWNDPKAMRQVRGDSKAPCELHPAIGDYAIGLSCPAIMFD